MKYLLFVILLALPLLAQDHQTLEKCGDLACSGSTLNLSSVSDVKPTAFVVMSNNNKEVMRINPDGSIIFAEGVTPSQAAKEFAKYLKEYMKCEAPPKETK
jgi:hypothetical protein